MKTNKTFRKITMATGVVALSVGLIQSFDVNATQTTGSGDRYYALGEDGTNICFCDTAGTKCVCR